MAKKAAVVKDEQYEGMFLLPASAATDAEAALSLVRGIIEKHEGYILVIKKWDERKLAYEINGQKRGTYVVAFFTAPGKAIGAIEREVNLSEQVLRVLILRADHLNKDEMEKVEPQPIQPREERAPWDRPGFNVDDRRPRRDDRAPRREEAGAEASAKD